MNWYKLALKQQDIYEFYAYQGLSDETLMRHPELLYDFVMKLNSIREYYLDYLWKEISDELEYIFGRKALFSQVFQEPEKISHMKSMEKAKVLSVINAIKSHKITPTIINAAMFYFNNLPWRKVYGGPLWAQITYWAYELYKINIISPIPAVTLIEETKKMARAIDTIHSLHHNNDFVLDQLPQGEARWLQPVLEIIKRLPDPRVIAQMSGNRALMNVYKREEISSRPPLSIPDTLAQMFANSELNQTKLDFYNMSKEEADKIDILRNAFRNNRDIPTILSIAEQSPHLATRILTDNLMTTENLPLFKHVLQILFNQLGRERALDKLATHLTTEGGIYLFYCDILAYLISMNNVDLDYMIIKNRPKNFDVIPDAMKMLYSRYLVQEPTVGVAQMNALLLKNLIEEFNLPPLCEVFPEIENEK